MKNDISVDVKANKKMSVQNLIYNIKGACILHLILVDILSILILPLRTVAWGRGCLTDKIR